MKKNLLIPVLVLSYQLLVAQVLNFDPPKKLFDHPIEGLLDFAFIPLDYNQDGRTDYIGRSADQELIVYLGTANGFEITDSIDSEPYSRPYDILDFDQDGDEDIIMEGYIYLYEATTNDYTLLSTSDEPLYLPSISGVADFDGNGYNDLLVTYGFTSSPSDLSILFWDGNTFEKVSFPNDIRTGPIQIGDLEGDGDIDIAVIEKYQSNSPVLLINDGTGNFEERPVLGYSILSNRTLQFQDFDTDGDLDLFVQNINHELVIYENTDNFITPPFQYRMGTGNMIASQVADFNADGNLEIVTFEAQPDLFTVNLYQRTAGTLDYAFAKRLASFSVPSFFVSFNANYVNNTIRTRDVNFDGALDIILSFALGNDPAVYLIENINALALSTNTLNYQHLTTYPNPARESLHLKNLPLIDNTATYRIVNTFGQVVQIGAVEQAINISNLLAGQYYLCFKTDTDNYLAKFVKK